MVKHYIFGLLLLFSFSFNSIAQKKKSFAKDEAGFIKDASKLISSYNKKAGKQLELNLQAAFSSGYFSEENKKSIIAFSNAFIKRRALAHPHFDLYFNTILAFQKNNIPSQAFTSWQSYLSNLLARKKTTLTKLTTLLKTSNKFIVENSVEEKILELQKKKKDLQALYEESVNIHKLSREEILSLFES